MIFFSILLVCTIAACFFCKKTAAEIHSRKKELNQEIKIVVPSMFSCVGSLIGSFFCVFLGMFTIWLTNDIYIKIIWMISIGAMAILLLLIAVFWSNEVIQYNNETFTLGWYKRWRKEYHYDDITRILSANSMSYVIYINKKVISSHNYSKDFYYFKIKSLEKLEDRRIKNENENTIENLVKNTADDLYGNKYKNADSKNVTVGFEIDEKEDLNEGNMNFHVPSDIKEESRIIQTFFVVLFGIVFCILPFCYIVRNSILKIEINWAQLYWVIPMCIFAFPDVWKELSLLWRRIEICTTGLNVYYFGIKKHIDWKEIKEVCICYKPIHKRTIPQTFMQKTIICFVTKKAKKNSWGYWDIYSVFSYRKVLYITYCDEILAILHKVCQKEIKDLRNTKVYADVMKDVISK